MFAKADAVTAPTPAAVELLVRSAGLPDAFPISCGIDVERYRAEPRDLDAVPTVLFVGRMDQEKRGDELSRLLLHYPSEFRRSWNWSVMAPPSRGSSRRRIGWTTRVIASAR